MSGRIENKGKIPLKPFRTGEDDSEQEICSRLENELSPVVTRIISDGEVTQDEMREMMRILGERGVEDSQRNQEMVKQYLEKEIQKLKEQEEAKKKEREEEEAKIAKAVAGVISGLATVFLLGSVSPAVNLPQPNVPNLKVSGKSLDLDD